MSAKFEHAKAVAMRQAEAFFQQDLPLEIYEEALRERLGNLEWEDAYIDRAIEFFRIFIEDIKVEFGGEEDDTEN